MALTPPLSLDQYAVSFWAVRGESRSVQINYSSSIDNDVHPFLLLTTTDPQFVPGVGELAMGDSVLITVTVDVRDDEAPNLGRRIVDSNGSVHPRERDVDLAAGVTRRGDLVDATIAVKIPIGVDGHATSRLSRLCARVHRSRGECYPEHAQDERQDVHAQPTRPGRSIFYGKDHRILIIPRISDSLAQGPSIAQRLCLRRSPGGASESSASTSPALPQVPSTTWDSR